MIQLYSVEIDLSAGQFHQLATEMYQLAKEENSD